MIRNNSKGFFSKVPRASTANFRKRASFSCGYISVSRLPNGHINTRPEKSFLQLPNHLDTESASCVDSLTADGATLASF